MTSSRWLFVVVKLAVSAVLIVFFLRHLDFDETVAAVSQLSYFPVSVAIMLLAAIIALFGMRWHRILCALDIRLGRMESVRMTFIGAFFNQVLPTSMGGDAVRVWHTKQAGFGWKRAAASTVLERLSGAAGLVPLTGFGVWYLWDGLEAPGRRAVIFLLIAVLVAAIVVLATIDRLPRRLRRIPGMNVAESFAPFVRTIFTDVRLAPYLIVTSICGHIMAALALFELASALDLPVTPLQCVAIVPIVILVTLIPLSFAGWGLREGAMIVLLQSVSVNFHDAVILALLFGVSLFVAALPGLAIWIFFRPRAGATPRDRKMR